MDWVQVNILLKSLYSQKDRIETYYAMYSISFNSRIIVIKRYDKEDNSVNSIIFQKDRDKLNSVHCRDFLQRLRREDRLLQILQEEDIYSIL